MSGMFMFNLHNLGRETRAIAFAADLNAVLLARITDHWRWFASLQRYVFDDSITTLEVQEDMRQCGFGKWYYGPQRAAAEAFSPAIAEPLRLIEEEHSALHVSASEIKQHQMEGNAAESQIIFEKISMQNVLTVQKLLHQISTIMDKDIKESARKFDSQVVDTLTITAGIVIFASLLALFMGIVITRNITEPVLRIARYIQSVSEGRLDAALIMMRRDELGQLADNLKSMVASVASMIREIKSQKQQTQEAEECLRILLDTIPQGAILLDMEYNIIDCNQTALHMFNYTDKAEYMAHFHERDPECQPDGTPSGEKRAALLRAAFETGHQNFEWMYRLPSGDVLPTEITLIRIPWKGEWLLASYIRDLRERQKRLEAEKANELKVREAYEQAQSLKAASQAARLASQAKSEFLAKMSHELRTPLNAAIGFLGLELQNELSPASADNLEISLDACHTLLHLINDILDISKIEAGHFELTKTDYHLVSLINEVVSLNSFRLLDNSFNMKAKPLAFRLEVDENLPSQLHGDDLRIKQVLNNLLSNAFKYTEKGEITLSVGPAAGEGEQGDGLPIYFSIRDTGQGIKAKNLKNLFTSYTRFDSKANRLVEGTGLGLAICKGLVEKMGWTNTCGKQI